MDKEYIAILDMQKMEGWKIYQQRVREEIDMATIQLQDIRREGRTLQDIASEYVTLIERINGLSRALSIAEDIKERAQREQ